MTEAVETTTETQSQEQQTSIQELAAFAFNKPTPQQETSAINGEQAATTETATTEAAATTTTQTEAAVQAPDFNAYLKEHFGVDNIETAKAEWQSLQELKAKSPSAEDFANEESKKIHELLRQGKTKEVGQWIQAQELLANVDTMASEQKLKLYIKMQNPRFDNELIEDEYNTLYTFNQDEATYMEPLAERKERLKLEQRIENDLQKAQEYFEQYKTKIQLPDIHKSTIDEGYEAYKASNANATEAYNNVTVPAIKALKETDVPLNISINDANNKMQFDINIVPEPTDFESARQDSLSLDQFLAKTCYTEDGKFVPQNLQRIILLAKNFDKYGQSIARQAVNAERKRVIELETVGGGLHRNFNTQVEPTELDALKQFAFQKVG